MLERTAQPIRGSHGDDIELATHRAFENAVKSRSLVSAFGAADSVILVFGDHCVSAALRPRPQLGHLIGDGLPFRADTARIMLNSSVQNAPTVPDAARCLDHLLADANLCPDRMAISSHQRA